MWCVTIPPPPKKINNVLFFISRFITNKLIDDVPGRVLVWWAEHETLSRYRTCGDLYRFNNSDGSILFTLLSLCHSRVK